LEHGPKELIRLLEAGLLDSGNNAKKGRRPALPRRSRRFDELFDG
jgi:hypothetical protein